MRRRIDEIATSPDTQQALAGLAPRGARYDSERAAKDFTGSGADAAHE